MNKKTIEALAATALAVILAMGCGRQMTATPQQSETASIHTYPGEATRAPVSSVPEEQMLVSWAEGAESIKALYEMSDVVAVGKVAGIASQSEVVVGETRMGREVVYLTDYMFQIDRALKGTSENVAMVRQTEQPNGNGEIKDDPAFQIGAHYVLFLREGELGKHHVIGGPQGRFVLVNGQVFSMNFFVPERNIHLPEGLHVNGLNEADFLQSLTSRAK